MYSNTGAILRGDIQQAVVQAGGASEGLIGAQVMPPLPVATKAGQYLKIDVASGHLMRVEGDGATKRNADGSYSRISRAFTSDTYLCEDRGLEELIDDSQQADIARFIDTEATIARLLLRNIQLAHETRVASAIFGGTFNSTPAGTAWTSASADPVTDLLDALARLRKKGVAGNALVLNLDAYNLLRKNAKMQSYIFGSVGTGDLRNVDAALISANLGIQNVFVATAAYDSSKKGQASASGSFIWASNKAWIGNVASGDFVAGGAGRTLTWSGDANDLFVVETYRDESRRSGVVRVRQHTAEKVVDSTAGELITW